jgi:hypothetical protein
MVSIEITPIHLEILQAIGFDGAPWSELKTVGLAREFDDLRHAKLIVYWPEGQPPPVSMLSSDSGRPGHWYLTIAGAEAAGIELPPLRLAEPPAPE